MSDALASRPLASEGPSMSTPDLILCGIAAAILVPMAFLPFLVAAGERDGIVKTGRSGDDR